MMTIVSAARKAIPELEHEHHGALASVIKCSGGIFNSIAKCQWDTREQGADNGFEKKEKKNHFVATCRRDAFFFLSLLTCPH